MKPLPYSGSFINISLLLLAFACLPHASQTQNISNDTITVNEKAIVELVFNAPSSAVIPNGDGSYEIRAGTGTSLLISARKRGASTQPMIVREGGREHKLVLTYQESSTARRYDYSDVNKIAQREKTQSPQHQLADTLQLPYDEKDKGRNPDRAEREMLRKTLQEANSDYDQQKWDAAWNKYLKIEPFKFKERSLVRQRLKEIAIIKRNEAALRATKFNEAIAEADGHAAAKRFIEEEQALEKALTFSAGDAMVVKRLEDVRPKAAQQRKENKTALVLQLIKKGDQAVSAKKYLDADDFFNEALNLDPANKDASKKKNAISNHVKAARYKVARGEGDKLFSAKDYAGAKLAYEQAINFKPKDPHATGQLLKIEKHFNLNTMRDNYLQAIANADKARDNKDFEKALREYQRASRIFPDSTYPVKQAGIINQSLKGNAENKTDKNLKVSATANKGL